MKLDKSELRKLVKGVLIEMLDEAEPASIPQTVPTDPGLVSGVQKKESPAERKRRLRDKFKQKSANKDSTDIRTPEGRDNVLDKVYYEFGDVRARISIISKLAQQASNAENRQDFKAALVQMFDNLNNLKNRDLPKLHKGYTEVAILTGLKKVPMAEADMNPDTPEGRKNLVRKLFNTVGELLKVAEEGNKMIMNARQSNNVSVYMNELKALGGIVRQITQQLVGLNAAFVETFQEYERQRGR